MRITKILKNKDIGAIGIGAMIVFIAMVLVAGIAASVLVQTANKLEIQAMQTGDQTTAEVATGLHVFDIEGKQVSDYIVNLTLTVKPRAGSKDIDLEETIIELCDGAKKVLLSYNESNVWNFNSSVDSDGQVFGTGGWNQSNEEFGILVLEDADQSCSSATTPVINRGDLVMLTISCTGCGFNTGNGLEPRDDIWGQVIPEEGSSGHFAFRVPASLSDTVYDLY